MRIWKKYIVSEYLQSSERQRKIDVEGFSEDLADLPKSLDDLLKRTQGYLPKIMQRNLRNLLKKDDRVISVGAGDGEHEFPLITEGYRITISDFNESRLINLRKLCPDCKTESIDLLKNNFSVQYANHIGAYDVAFAPGIIYAFDNEKLIQILRNIKSLVKPGGRVIIVFRSRDTIITKIIDYLCFWDTLAYVTLMKILGRKRRFFYTKIHGYRRTLREMKKIMEECGLPIEEIRVDDYQSEWGRLYFLSRTRISWILGNTFRCFSSHLHFLSAGVR